MAKAVAVASLIKNRAERHGCVSTYSIHQMFNWPPYSQSGSATRLARLARLGNPIMLTDWPDYDLLLKNRQKQMYFFQKLIRVL